MDTCDVLIVGGGPAGSTCAWALRRAGLDVLVLDNALFPRDKVCAGWITPQVLTDLCFDVEAYGQRHTLQPFTAFRIGLIGGIREMEVAYDHPVSFGIRRCEFDHYLLERSDARRRLGTPITSIRRDGSRWTVNESVKASMLVGAGGHFCPVARMLNGSSPHPPLVVAQEAEFAIDPGEAASCTIEPDRPELYFSRSLNGYGWCLRKQHYLNIGFGHLDRHRLPSATARFEAFLKAKHKVPARIPCRWKGHAYLLAGVPGRRIVDDGVLLIGDAAGLAYPQSGEGIRPAIESGLVAAWTILEAHGRYTTDQLLSYQDRIRERLGSGPWRASAVSQTLAPHLGRLLGPWLLRIPWFVRHVLLNRWFLHAREPTLAMAGADSRHHLPRKPGRKRKEETVE